MNKNRFGEKGGDRFVLWDIVFPVAVIVVALLLMSYGMDALNTRTERERLQSAKDAVTRAAVQCYALEGRYPMSVTYLEENYGLRVNREKYIVHYQAFASNLMPDIDVFPLDAPNMFSLGGDGEWDSGFADFE